MDTRIISPREQITRTTTVEKLRLQAPRSIRFGPCRYVTSMLTTNRVNESKATGRSLRNSIERCHLCIIPPFHHGALVLTFSLNTEKDIKIIPFFLFFWIFCPILLSRGENDFLQSCDQILKFFRIVVSWNSTLSRFYVSETQFFFANFLRTGPTNTCFRVLTTVALYICEFLRRRKWFPAVRRHVSRFDEHTRMPGPSAQPDHGDLIRFPFSVNICHGTWTFYERIKGGSICFPFSRLEITIRFDGDNDSRIGRTRFYR